MISHESSEKCRREQGDGGRTDCGGCGGGGGTSSDGHSHRTVIVQLWIAVLQPEAEGSSLNTSRESCLIPNIEGGWWTWLRDLESKVFDLAFFDFTKLLDDQLLQARHTDRRGFLQVLFECPTVSLL